MPTSKSAAPVRNKTLPGEACHFCPVLKRTEWCVLKEERLETLALNKTCTTYAPGEEVFRQGESCDGIFCIKAGTIALRKTDAQGNSVITRLVHAGDTVGYRTFFAGGSFTASAEALTESKVCFVDRKTVRHVLEMNPNLGERFLRRLAQALRSAEDDKLESAAQPVRARVAHLILDLADRYGVQTDDAALVFDLPLARQDMAAVIGVRPESITRAIRALEKSGVAIFKGRTVTIPSIEALVQELSELTELT